jgi:hypothetical protein
MLSTKPSIQSTARSSKRHWNVSDWTIVGFILFFYQNVIGLSIGLSLKDHGPDICSLCKIIIYFTQSKDLLHTLDVLVFILV